MVELGKGAAVLENSQKVKHSYYMTQEFHFYRYALENWYIFIEKLIHEYS